MELDARGRRLHAALAAVLVRDNTPELRLMHDWLDSWPGVSLVLAGMVGGSAWQPTPWAAVQRAAWEPVKRSV